MLYDEFINSLEEKENIPLMTHTLSTISIAKLYFKDYLTEDELCEKQYSGRFWDITQVCEYNNYDYRLYIALDNDIAIMVANNGQESIIDRTAVPKSLRGMHYN